MALHNAREQMTEREREEFEQEKLAAEMQASYNLKIKEMDMEIARLEAKWTNVLRLPVAIITLPVRVVLAFGYLVTAAKKEKPDESFWKFLNKW